MVAVTGRLLDSQGFTLVPSIHATLEATFAFVDSARMRRIHEKAVRNAITDTLLKHWRKRVPQHFKQNARTRYDHDERKAPYKKIKRRQHHSITDLVKTGRTKFAMTTRKPRVQFGGGAGLRSSLGAGTRGRIFLSFPFPTSRDNFTPGGVRIAQMAKEISTWTSDEVQQAAREFQLSYQEHLILLLARSPRLKKKFGPAFTT